jgi:chemotaxis signal transduction protein
VVCVAELSGLLGWPERVTAGQVVLLDLPRMDLGLQVDEVTDIAEVEWAPGGVAGSLIRPATDRHGALDFLDAEAVAEGVRAACQPAGPARPRTV